MTCRLCLCSITDTSSIPIYGNSKSLELQELISDCCQLQVKKHDGLSQTMCSSCEHNLTLFTQFKNICKQSDKGRRQKPPECLDMKTEVFLDDLVWEDEPNSQLCKLPNDYRNIKMRPSSCNPEESTPNIDEPSSNEGNIDTEQPNCNSVTDSQQNITEPSNTLNSQSTTPKPTMELKFSTTERGKRMLIHSGFEYIHLRVTNGVSTWRCRLGRSMWCHASLKTKNDVIVCQPSAHCHDSCPQNVEANIAKRRMVQAMNAAGASSLHVIGSVLSEVSNEALAYLPKKSSLSRTLLKYEKRNNPSIPMTTNFKIPERYHYFVLHDTGVDDPSRIMAFGDSELVKELNKNVIFGDGTFDIVPQIFFQLYTWHARVGNFYPPCVYFLLQNKTAATYERMFHIIKQLVPDLAPEKIYLDLEKVAINAAHSAFPQSEVRGCYFHVTQNLVKKIKNVGLKPAFENDLEVKLNLKSLPALAFVPADDVKNIFLQLTATFPEEDCYEEIATYFCTTYVEGLAGRSPQFPITVWNHYSAAIEKSHKTNWCKGFHNALNALFNCSNPSIRFLLDGLQRDLASQQLAVAKIKSGRLETKNTKLERLNDIVSSVVSEYHQTENKLLYLRNVANLQ